MLTFFTFLKNLIFGKGDETGDRDYEVIKDTKDETVLQFPGRVRLGFKKATTKIKYIPDEVVEKVSNAISEAITLRDSDVQPRLISVTYKCSDKDVARMREQYAQTVKGEVVEFRVGTREICVRVGWDTDGEPDTHENILNAFFRLVGEEISDSRDVTVEIQERPSLPFFNSQLTAG